MGKLKSTALKLSSACYLPRLFSPAPKNALTTLLYHRFFAPGETLEDGRSRLKYQLEWLQKNYTAIDTKTAVDGINDGDLPNSALSITADDALVDLLNVYDIFREFETPLTVFVCTGWVDNNLPIGISSMSRNVDFIRWYKGDNRIIDLGKFGAIELNEKLLDNSIDKLIHDGKRFGEEYSSYVWEAFRKLLPKNETRIICNWDELKGLYNQGIKIGSHSVSHCDLAQCSPTRLNFELTESKNTLEQYFDECKMFAYPFGTKNVVNDATTADLKKKGYDSGYLTKANFSKTYSDPFKLARIVIPDHDVTFAEFKARTLGATIPMEIFK